MKEFGASLRILRKQHKLSLKELSEKTGISVSFLSSIERGEKSPTLDTLLKLSSAFNINISEMTGQSASSMTPEIKSLINAAQNFSPAQIELIAKFLDDFSRSGT